MKSFNDKCYTLLRKVPSGKVTTYQEIAHALNTKAYRAIGNAMNKNPYGYLNRDFLQMYVKKSPTSIGREVKKKPLRCLLVACHRVIRSNGEVGGFLHGTKKKIEMLKKEGVEINNNKINLKKYLYKFSRI